MRTSTVAKLSSFAMSMTAIGAQTGWHQVDVNLNMGLLRSPAMVSDTVRQRVVLFGGYRQLQMFDGTWEWDGSNWTQRFSVLSPSPRFLSAMAFDRVRQRVVLFGGEGVGGLLADTWEWSGSTWMLRSTPVHPSARGRHVMAFDELRQRVVLFGGGDYPTVFHDDTWEWDGFAWTQCMPTVRPMPRHWPAFAYDAVRQNVVLFGGGTANGQASDTWTWNGAVWSLLAPPVSPPGRGASSMAFDPRRRVAILHGGYTTGLGGYANDTWEWDAASWSQVGTGPNRGEHILAFDSVSNRVLFCGGSDGYSQFADTWSYVPPAAYIPFGAGCLGPTATTPVLAGVPGESPRLGTTSHVRVANLPPTVTVPVFVFGDSNTWNPGPPAYPLPLDLAVLGWPGCQQLVSNEFTYFAITTTGQADHPIAVPMNTNLVGHTFHGQVLVLYSGGGVAVSNGVTAVVGW